MPSGPASLDPVRPFGADLHAAWWKPPVLLVVLSAGPSGVQVARRALGARRCHQPFGCDRVWRLVTGGGPL
ncbi:hypothetical protein [Pseudonocardia sp. ICBG162]|uniref:hypothetical protein n=1 Tax=Pseudonocardia sp. ICBG162 TaxID=2846761 RepID=UPI001CF63005|nr:hypothetical protein [Pseudonocardia sp. ICBG162]